MVTENRPVIAVIGSKGLHSEYGGVEKIVYQITHALRERYHFIVYGNSRYKDDESLDTRGITATYLQLPRIKLSGALLLSFFATLIALRRGVDLLYFHACGPGFFTFLARLSGKKTVWHFHGSDYRRSLAVLNRVDMPQNQLAVIKQYVRYCFLKVGEIVALHSAHKVFVLGKSNYQTLCDLYPRARSKLVTATNFVSLEEVDRAELLQQYDLESGNYLLSVSRLVPEKRIDLLIKVFKHVKPDYPNIRLIIVGAGEEQTRLKSLAEADPKILFLGAQPHKYMYTFYQHALLFCLFSTIEGQPLSMLEAMSCGCPVMASDIPEIAEFGTDFLFLFRHEDQDHCQTTLRGILEKPAEVKSKAEQARIMVRQTYSRDIATRTLNSVFESLL